MPLALSRERRLIEYKQTSKGIIVLSIKKFGLHNGFLTQSVQRRVLLANPTNTASQS